MRMLTPLVLVFALYSGIATAQVCPVKRPALTALDHKSMVLAVEASFIGLYGHAPSGLAGSGPNDTNYWVAVSDHYGEFSDGICRAGWSAYWEVKLGSLAESVSPALADQPARFQPNQEPPPPPVVIVPPPPPPPVQPPVLPSVATCDLTSIEIAIANLRADVDAGRAENQAFYQAVGIQWRKILLFAGKYGGAILAGFWAHQATK